MATTADIRKGFAFEYEGKIYLVIDFQHVKPGKGGAFVRTKLRNLENGNIVDMTFDSGKSLNEIRLERNPFQFLYKDGEEYVFMNNETYEQISVGVDILQEKKFYLKENMDVTLLFAGERVIDIDLPIFVELEIVETEPGLRGNTVSGGSKPAVCDTGLKVTVPLFLNVGDKIRIDTRTGEYVERVQ
ncbi:MAG: elongation factor P [bacterium]|nr:elongation factor P [bacterium]